MSVETIRVCEYTDRVPQVRFVNLGLGLIFVSLLSKRSVPIVLSLMHGQRKHRQTVFPHCNNPEQLAITRNCKIPKSNLPQNRPWSRLRHRNLFAVPYLS